MDSPLTLAIKDLRHAFITTELACEDAFNELRRLQDIDFAAFEF